MATNFRYTPLPPEPISGPDVLAQTEAAINDIGDRVDQSSSSSVEALRVAQEALTTANAAQATAEAAGLTANAAQNAANAAVSTANAATTTANSALSTAQAAQSTATDAQATATEASETAQDAVTISNEALERANSAYDAAGTAQSAAAEAGGIATTAMGIYAVDATESLDADTLHTEAQKVFVTGATPVNFPTTDVPFYADVVVNSDSTSATQRVWSQNGLEEWRRVASITPGDEENPDPVVTWSDWVAVGSTPDEEPGWLPLFFALPSDEPTRSMIPPGYTAASVQSYETDGASTTVTLEASPAVGEAAAIAIPDYPATVDVSALVSKGVNFTVNYTGDEPTEAFVLLRLSP